ncbi:MAG: hypothetical protein DI539_22105 [Flavobacterium psychrophilum]|nr:MAG: hypothetical protein DI539_22105 [Flavobacterium psychrophilum]
MKKHIPSIAISLFISLYIYVFYRTSKTLINKLIVQLFSYEDYIALKEQINSALPLNDYIVFSLPEGLWIYCITILSGPFCFMIGKRRYNLVFVPLVTAVVMELFQLLHITNGRFDWMDILFSFCFWLLAYLQTKRITKEIIFKSFNARTVWCVSCYSIVYLAHVFY